MNVRNGVLAIVFAIAGATFVHAETKTKPQISITTKSVEVTVTVDPALRKFPGLFEDSLAEGKRWAERNRTEAAKASRDEPLFFRGGRRWTFERAYALRSVVDRYISVLRDDGTFTGGAHPNSYADTILWDRDTRKRTNVRPFFRETADNGPTMTALAQLARVAVAAEKLSRDAINVDVPKEKLTPEQLAKLDTFIVRRHPALAAQDRSDLARALDRGRQKLRPHLPLFALCGRRLCGRSLYRVRAVDRVPVASVAAGRRDLRRPASRKRQHSVN